MSNEERFDMYSDTHDFLAEGLLVPFVNQTNNNRLQMFNSHVGQAIQLEQAEPPKVFTGFENQIGEHSTGYNKVKGIWKVLKKIKKNEFNYILIIRNEMTLEYDIVYRTEAENLTEHFGYKLDNNVMDSIVEGEIIEDKIVSHDMNYDSDMNFQYGKNLNVAYLAFSGHTNEDSIVISESTADKMSSYFVEKIDVNINTNDVLLNIYGDENTYKTFPSIGEKINEDGVLLATRRIIYTDIISKLKDKLLSKYIDGDTRKYAHKGATVIDINIYSNKDLNNLSQEPYNSQILENYFNLLRYYNEVVDYLKPILFNKRSKFSNELRTFYNKIASFRDPLTEFENSGRRFDNIVAEFTILYKKPLTPGAKLTNRYGI